MLDGEEGGLGSMGELGGGSEERRVIGAEGTGDIKTGSSTSMIVVLSGRVSRVTVGVVEALAGVC